jgi:tripartite ATP-independent transporter DctM subunit
MSTGLMIGLIVLAVFLVLLLIGLPVSVTMMVCGVFGSMFLLRTPTSAFTFLTTAVVSTFTSYSTCVAPMFILMGELASETGLGSNMFDALQKIMGRRKGGLASAVQVVCAIFGAICGSASATSAMMCRVAYPQMKKYNYSDGLSTGCIASGASLATLIPPSVLLITYGIAVEESIGKLFIGGILTGIVLMILFIITIQIWCVIQPDIAPAGEKSTLKEKFRAVREGSFIEIGLVFVPVDGRNVCRLVYADRGGRRGRGRNDTGFDHFQNSLRSRL